MLIYVIFTMVDVADFYKLNKSNGFRNLSPAIATAYHWVGCRTCTYPARGTRRQQPGGTPCMRPAQCKATTDAAAAAGGCLRSTSSPARRRRRQLERTLVPAPAPG